MANATWYTDPDLINELVEHPEAFTLFQALRLLEREGRYRKLARPLHISAQLTLATAVAEVSAAVVDDDQIAVETTRPALYGAASPLPRFYSEDLIDAELEEHSFSKVLFDTLNQRLFEIDDAGRRYYDLPYNHVERQDARFVALLRSFIGVRDPAVDATLNVQQLLRYSALFGRRQRSAAGLKVMLQNQLPAYEVVIEQCVAREVQLPITECLSLGGRVQNRLGDDTMIGDWVEESGGKFVIRLALKSGDHSSARERQWFSHAAERQQLVDLVRYYIDTPLACDIILTLPSDMVTSCTIGSDKSWSELGRSTWLVDSAHSDTVSSVIRVQ
ncbi:MAG: type VI secretion system baseplate subunit TssG [Gammaproteobacteria bacterium]|nr:type VI secretion system baseplate subunit TssG [Gammaproteobacteria bacterium]